METREETVSLWYELTAAAPSNLAADECSQEGLVGNGSHSVSFHESRSDFFWLQHDFFFAVVRFMDRGKLHGTALCESA